MGSDGRGWLEAFPSVYKKVGGGGKGMVVVIVIADMF